MKYPRLIVSALSGGSGKTITSLGIVSALKAKGHLIAPFKKGPDYIDAGWLALAAGQPCYNLDTFLLTPSKIIQLFLTYTQQESISLIEANRGIYDSIDTQGTTSTAELAKLLQAPVILCLDCTKTTRTLAALVHGCMIFDPKVLFAGIVLNRVAGVRHEGIIRQCIEGHTGVPVVGAIPKLNDNIFPERHMGLVPTSEHQWADNAIDSAQHVAEKYLDLQQIAHIAQQAVSLSQTNITSPAKISHQTKTVRIGIARDAAFQFYYSENLEALSREGASLVFISPMSDTKLPDLDAFYLGGGFPETQSRQLSQNHSFRKSLQESVKRGLPVYAECGGLMYLGQTVIVDNTPFEMANIFSIQFDLSTRPIAHGYSIIKVAHPNPVFPVGMELRGHEFHYSRVVKWNKSDETLAFQVMRGKGFWEKQDGLCCHNVIAAYTHVHAWGTPQWAVGLVQAARNYQAKKGP
ncbi:MAG: cobyrinic acid a,c-diamide synthase [Candidatus Magnetoglobus multicellularis str. Araruama]|uniref:Cobyrinate a,c-diamide synthase n=1 Tax=Candidatus Magnetoglobus multicellularis str. Araruama TaxID=890399 RepID=A0A1V1P7S0_9BACT|nr:MAG: cobyrinic acid a,c-diamide synthase [Candidatus Magnetoglobus multicellularis str. Araruama]